MIPVQIQLLSPAPNTALPNIGTAGNISGNAPQVPPAIANLPAGTLVEGFVLNRSANGQPILRSNFGDLLIQSSVFLRIGSEVTIRVRASGEQFRADIIKVDGKPVTAENGANTQRHANQATINPSTTHKPDTWEGRQDTIQRSQLLPNVDAKGNVKGSFTFNAVLLNPSANATSLQLRQGNPLTLQLLNLQLAPTTPNATASTTTTSTTQAPITTPTANTQQPTNQAVQAYSQHQPTGPATNINAASPNTTTTQALLQQPHTLTVIGHEQDGDPIVQTPFGLAKITSRTNLPVGTTLQAQIALPPNTAPNPLAAGQPQAASNPTSSSLLNLAHDWPALQQIIQLLGPGTDNSLTTSITALPQLSLAPTANITLQPAQFTNGFFLFFAALQGGDFRGFLGEKNIQKLQQAGQQQLLNQVQTEFSQLTRLAADVPGQQWQTMFFPVLVDGQVEMLRWFSKRDQQSKKDNKKESNATRFIVELNTSILGELQLDGLYRYETEHNKLELVLRSHSPLDAEIRQGIMQIVQDVNDTTGLIGNITFQSLAQFPEHPLEEVLNDIPDVIA